MRNYKKCHECGHECINNRKELNEKLFQLAPIIEPYIAQILIRPEVPKPSFWNKVKANFFKLFLKYKKNETNS